MPDVTSLIGAGKAYTTIGGWEFDADVSTGFWRGELADNAEYVENVVISNPVGTPTIVNNVQLAANDPVIHTGSAGTGARIRSTVNGSHTIHILDDFTLIENLEIRLDSTGPSDEAIRIGATGNTVDGALISRCIIWTNSAAADTDGLYMGNWPGSVFVDNTIIYGFRRAGSHAQNYSTATASTQTWNFDFCTIDDCGDVGEAESGAINSRTGFGGSVNNFNIYNTAGLNTRGGYDDFSEFGSVGSRNWIGSNNASSDGSLTARGIATGAQENLALTATSQSSGSFFVVKNITAASEDYQLLDDAAGNLAYGNGVSRVSSEPDSRQDFSLDIVGNLRSTTSPTPDIGASEYTAAGGATISPATGSISITGQDVSLAQSFTLTPANDSISIAGQNADMTFGGTISPSIGLMNINGQAVTVDVLTSINPANGTISVSGQNVDISALRILSPGSATLSINGQAVTVDAVFVQIKETGFIFKLVGPLVSDLIKELV